MKDVLPHAIVIPCYNEEKRLQVKTYKKFLERSPATTFCFVNDGSCDGTEKILEELAQGPISSRVLIVNKEKNEGKAEAVRTGLNYLLEKNEYSVLGFWDADLATPLEEIPQFVSILAETPSSYVTGARIRRLGSQVSRKNSRHYIGRIFATITSLLLGIAVYDTQCGAKVIRSELAKKIFAMPFKGKWLFDVELLFRIKQLQDQEIEKIVYEVPLKEWQDIQGSKLKIFDFFKAPFELFKIYFSYRT